MQKAGADTGGQSAHAEDVFHRDRPFAIDREPVREAGTDLFHRRAAI